MKKQTALWCLSLLLVMGACTTSSSRKTAGEWAKVPGILKNIVPPVIADTVYDVTDYGAKSDTTFDSRPAILQAISHCNTNGGGTVLIPAGNYFIKGAITLKSNINLHIAEGARLEFSTEAADYLPMVLTKWEGTECFNYSPFIYAYQCTNVAVTGKGTRRKRFGDFQRLACHTRSCRRPSAPNGYRFRSCIPTRIRRRTLSASLYDTILRLQERIGRRFKNLRFSLLDHSSRILRQRNRTECIYRQQQLQ